jgi:PhnB protein
MPKRSPAEQLDRAITELLAPDKRMSAAQQRRTTRVAERPRAEVTKLIAVAEALRNLPRPEFRARLRVALATDFETDFERRTTVSEATVRVEESPKFRRANFPNIAPYFLVKDAPKFIDFLVGAFDGVERVRVPRPDATVLHAEVAIGNSVIEMGDANEQYPARAMSTHLYVPDADATYARALRAGATGVYAPTDEHPSGDRWGEATDPFGNTWYIAARRGPQPGPEGFLTVQPYLHLRGAHEFIPFVEAAFGAHATGMHKSPDGLVRHATIELAGATFEVDEADGGIAATESYLHVYVPDTDAVYAQAVAAGATGVHSPYTAPYGDRAASVSDSFGNTWFLATFLGEPPLKHA